MELGNGDHKPVHHEQDVDIAQFVIEPDRQVQDHRRRRPEVRKADPVRIAQVDVLIGHRADVVVTDAAGLHLARHRQEALQSAAEQHESAHQVVAPDSGLARLVLR